MADAQRLLADAIKVSLSLQPDFEVIDESPVTGLDTVEAILRNKPDVSLVDYWMTGMEGPAITRMVLSRTAGQKIVILGWFHGPAEIKATRQAGATAFLSKELRDTDLVLAVRRVAEGGVPKAKPRSRRPSPQSRNDATWQRLTSLTPREVEILAKLAICGRPQEAAKQLSITPNTMRLHIQHILAKTGARNQVEAVALAREHGLI